MHNALALITDPNAWAALVTLTALEIVLGVDNVIFVSLLAANSTRSRAAAHARSDYCWRWFSASRCCSR